MTTETMTIHRALAELKVLDDRIMKLLSEAKFCGAAKNCMQKLGGVTIEEYKQNAQSTYDKITDLMARQAAIKRAVSESNAVTHAVVCGHDYTVAQLIWMNQHGIDFKSTLLNVLERQYASAVAATEAANSKLSDKADDFISRNNAGADKNSMDAEAIKDMLTNTISASSKMVLVWILSKNSVSVMMWNQIESRSQSVQPMVLWSASWVAPITSASMINAGIH